MRLHTKGRAIVLAGVLACGGGSLFGGGQAGMRRGNLGFDRNDYPGDAAMKELRKEFTFAGYWLTPPPGARTNSWTGKRKEMEALGYGFLLLARGQAGNAIRTAAAAGKIGVAEGREGVGGEKKGGVAGAATKECDVR